jgi:hypothetical protein
LLLAIFLLPSSTLRHTIKERGGNATTSRCGATREGWSDERGAAEDKEGDNDGGFYYCVSNGHDNGNDGNNGNNGNDGNDGGILKGGYMGYALREVGKGRTVIGGCREDAGTDDGKSDRGGGVVSLLNIAMPLATLGAVGIAIAAMLRVAAAHVTVFVLINLLYS